MSGRKYTAHEGGFIVEKIWLDNPRRGHEKKESKDIIGLMQKAFAKSTGLDFKSYENCYFFSTLKT